MRNTLMVAMMALGLAAAACSSDDSESGATTAPPDTAAPEATAAPTDDTLPTGPSDLTLEAQEGDGTTVSVASATLPVPGYVVIHGDGGGSPGAVIGHSDLLPAGVNNGVVVTLDQPITESATVFPMVHIDADGDGVYEFFPPDDTTDVPGTFADGGVAVAPLAVTVTVTGGSDAAGSALVISASGLGDILTDQAGNTLYLFEVDTQGEASSCTGDCAANWPAFTDTVTGGPGVEASLLGTAERDDGTVQVTYNGWPLYYFAGDSAPGDTNGQTIGDVWWVVDAAGDAIK